MSTRYGRHDAKFPFPGIVLQYYFDIGSDATFKVVPARYLRDLKSELPGTVVEVVRPTEAEGFATIELLKLHGSLNFQRRGAHEDAGPLTVALDAPYILPPIFNKLAATPPRDMWKVALDRLRSAKNIVIVGYSLPETDVYMQYFLKTAVGPNVNLNRVYVFDPVLFFENEHTQAMKARYESCFAPQLRNRLIFQPDVSMRGWGISSQPGTFSHFVELLGHDDGDIFF